MSVIPIDPIGSLCDELESSYLPRVVPDRGTFVCELSFCPRRCRIPIPTLGLGLTLTAIQTIVSMASLIIHENSFSYRKNLSTFIPERWLAGCQGKASDDTVATMRVPCPFLVQD